MNDSRYSDMPYVRCGRSGLMLPRVTSVLVGASRVSQLEENLGFLKRADLDAADWQEFESLIA